MLLEGRDSCTYFVVGDLFDGLLDHMVAVDVSYILGDVGIELLKDLSLPHMNYVLESYSDHRTCDVFRYSDRGEVINDAYL